MPAARVLLIRGGQVYDHDGDVHRPPTADILIEDGSVVAAGANLSCNSAHEAVDARGRLIVPGLINAHYLCVPKTLSRVDEATESPMLGQ
jgi:dihydroorotase-like cyclic amidohydrolase